MFDIFKKKEVIESGVKMAEVNAVLRSSSKGQKDTFTTAISSLEHKISLGNNYLSEVKSKRKKASQNKIKIVTNDVEQMQNLLSFYRTKQDLDEKRKKLG